MKNKAKADDVTLSEYVRIDREKKLKKSKDVNQFKCQICWCGQYASEKHIMCLMPKCIAKLNVRR